MTDRVVSLTVILDQEYRVDDVERLVEAIQMIRGVAHVEKGPVASVDTWFALTNVRQELLPKIIDLFNYDKFKKS
jgi:hypothetical protein